MGGSQISDVDLDHDEVYRDFACCDRMYSLSSC